MRARPMTARSIIEKAASGISKAGYSTDIGKVYTSAGVHSGARLPQPTTRNKLGDRRQGLAEIISPRDSVAHGKLSTSHPELTGKTACRGRNFSFGSHRQHQKATSFTGKRSGCTSSTQQL